MQLQALDINGFKSFPDRTVLQFDQGITAVVGPNGSGKSNIADAVRWVLGEQSGKTLRSGKMEDVIFSGTQQRKPMGFTSVSLTINNADRSLGIGSDEVVISRKLWHSGESEYRINGAAVRLRDINELFMDTGLGRDGYSIIGQGRIAEIISVKSAERREIFEEAAGISKYRYRKEQAEKRLEQARENLIRLKDILLELQGRVEPLRLAAQKAQEYVQLALRKKSLEVSLWLENLENSREQLRAQDDRLILAQTDHEQLQRQLEEIERFIRTVYDEIAGSNIATEEQRTAIQQMNSEASRMNSDLAVWSNDIEHNNETVFRLRETLAAHSRSRSELERQLEESAGLEKEKREQLTELFAHSGALREELLALEQKNGEALKEQAALTQERAAVAQQISNERLQAATSSTMLEQLRLNVESIDSQTRHEAVALEDHDKQLRDIRELLLNIEEELVSQSNIKKGYLIKHKAVSDRLSELQTAHADLLSRQKGYLQKARLIEDMEKNMEGFQSSVKYIMNRARDGELRGIEGPVSMLVRVSPEYSTAIEVALGFATQNIVVTNETAAKVAIEALKRARAGRATFLPMTVIKGRSLEEKGLESCEGFIALASELTECNAPYDAIVKNLLGRIVVARDLDCAVAIAKRYAYRFKLVTIDGQVVNPGGSMTGGSVSQSAGLLSRTGEIESLKRRALEAQAQINENTNESKAAGEELAGLNARISGIDADTRTMGEDRIRYESEEKRLRLSAADLEDRQRAAAQRGDELRRRLSELTQKSGSSDETLRQLGALSATLDEHLQEIIRQTTQMASNLKIKREEQGVFELQRVTLEKDIDMILQLTRQLKSQFETQAGQDEDLAAQITALEQKNEEIRRAIVHRQEQAQNLEERVKAANLEIIRLGQQRDTLEQKATALRQKERELHQKGEQLARDLSKLEERKRVIQGEYDAVITRLYDEYELTLSQAASERIPIEHSEAALRELNLIKSRIKAMGNINVAAIEEYREVNERYEFLKAQIDDVENSKAQLLKMIADLTGEMRDIFTGSFWAINEHFGSIFAELFGGGTGKLILTDAENVLDSGIEIYVQPPGKIIKNLAALSGGEQAFVAIAIYFAILKVRPSPFCLLDEIEAALDDVNVVKFAAYLRRLVGKTQFIAITHRRGTMEEADVLYGVTMQEEGVSKLLRLGVSELESKLGMK